jgi:hypothetical protein
MDMTPTVEELRDEAGHKIGVTVRQGNFAWTFTDRSLGPRHGNGDGNLTRHPIGEQDQCQGS